MTRRSTTARGYGRRHQLLRQHWAPVVASGTVDCNRCKQRIEPGTPWDLGHDDTDRSRYTGPEHQACNRATQTQERRAQRHQDPKGIPEESW